MVASLTLACSEPENQGTMEPAGSRVSTIRIQWAASGIMGELKSSETDAACNFIDDLDVEGSPAFQGLLLAHFHQQGREAGHVGGQAKA
jgi:hypothetical protein